ncbi:hypothetical protein [Oceanithermus sp.]
MKRRHYAGHDYLLLLECEAPLADGLVERLRQQGIAARVFSPYDDLAGIIAPGGGRVGVWVPEEAAAAARALLEGESDDAGD